MSKYIFEISWEIANKVGGIHTVLKSKAKYLKNHYQDNYLVIGPYIANKSEVEFKISNPPSQFALIIDNLKQKGINVYYGEWLIEGQINGFLIDFSRYLENVNVLKHILWEKFQIDSLRTGKDYDEPIAWSKAVSDFIKELAANRFNDSIFHFHEWLSGGAILFLKAEGYHLKTIFTTHATILGRTLMANNINFWDIDINPQQSAYDFFIEAKYGVEKNAAQQATLLTTISNITAKEVAKLLNREVDAILPNGIDINRFPTFEEIAFLHRRNKYQLLEFILYYFTPYFTKSCPIKNSLIFFTSGRKEITNKGFDITIEALGKLNNEMKAKDIDKNVYMILMIPDEFNGINPQIMQHILSYRSLEEYIDNLTEEIKSRILHSLIHQQQPEFIFSQEEMIDIYQILNIIKKPLPMSAPLSTHIFNNDNEIIKLCQAANLLNRQEDKVKIIFYPIYAHAADSLINLDYYNVINGCHLGIFPSLYEPWGYTPLETLAAGTIAITTDLTGFASYLQEHKHIDMNNQKGLYILQRYSKQREDIVNDLYNLLLKIVNMSRIERIHNKYEAKKLANICDWSKLINHYIALYYKLL